MNRTPARSLDHEVLLVLLNSERAVSQKAILSAPSPHLQSLRDVRQPYPALSRILDRLVHQGWATVQGSLYAAPALSEGAQFDLTTFLRCAEYGCARDHLAEYVVSGWVLRLAKMGGFGMLVTRVLAKSIVWEAQRSVASQHLPEDLEAWRVDLARGAVQHGVREADVPAFTSWITAWIADLARILAQGAWPERLEGVVKWLNPPLLRPGESAIPMFLGAKLLREDFFWAAAASPTFWRESLSPRLLEDSDFFPRAVDPANPVRLVSGPHAAKPGGTESEAMFGARVSASAKSLVYIWLLRDRYNYPWIDARLESLHVRLIFEDSGSKGRLRVIGPKSPTSVVRRS